MKNTYSAFAGYKLKDYQQWGTDEYVLKKVYYKELADGTDPTVAALIAMLGVACLNASKEYNAGTPTHYFFEGESMFRWLDCCKTPLNHEQVVLVKEFLDRAKAPAVLHYRGEGSPCIYVAVDKLTKRLFFTAGAGKISGFITGETRDAHIGPGAESHVHVMDLLSSSLAYILAFPECVREGIPPDLSHPNWYKGRRAAHVWMSEKLIVRDGPCPHFRIGHFRVLTSPRFKRKRGACIFIKGVFVKGHAKTVEEIKHDN